MPNVLTALRRRSYLVSAWPWRSLGFVATTALIATPVAGFVWMLGLPWLVAWRDLSDGRFPEVVVIVLMLLGAAAFAVSAPLLAIPLAVLERHRLALVDQRPVRGGHRPAPADPIAWLRLRYRERATWREVLYVCFLSVVVPAGYGTVALLALLDAVFVLSPILLQQQSGPIVLGMVEVRSAGQSAALSVLGVVLLPGVLYLIGLIAGLHAEVARGLLGGGDASLRELREVRQSRSRLLDAFEGERRRIERDLHDGAQHRLTSLTLQIGVARLDLPPGSPAAGPLAEAHTQAKDLMVVLRDLIHGIRPQTLADLGLLPALRELAERSALPVTVTGSLPEQRPDAAIESTAWFVACEALGNATRHAGPSRVDIAVRRDSDLLILEVTDDGRGGADPAAGTGLTGLADRAAAVGGRVRVGPGPSGGSRVRAELPWAP